MLAKRFFYVSAGILCLALAYHFGATSATAQAMFAGKEPGRFLIVVCGPADTFGNVWLLDSATGGTWVRGKVSEAEFYWTAVKRTETTLPGARKE